MGELGFHQHPEKPSAEGNVSGYYKNDVLGSGVNASDYAITGGPRFNFRPVFFHALFGVDHLSGHGFGLSASKTVSRLRSAGAYNIRSPRTGRFGQLLTMSSPTTISSAAVRRRITSAWAWA